MTLSAELLQRGYVPCAPELGSNISWKKSSKSQGNSNCVEFAEIGTVVAIRDSKNKNGPALTFSRNETADFIRLIKSGGLDDI